jgi:electron transport complex protein RnfG
MKEIVRLVGVLTLISAVAGVLLAYTAKVTRAPIEQARRQEMLDALAQVLPPFDNQPDTCLKAESDGGADWLFYVARKGSRFAGTAFVTTSTKGYAGPITIMAGLNADDTVRKIRILSHQETPGLGAKITHELFVAQFDGKSIPNTRWAVRKDGGEIDGITGATISSRAVADAIRRGCDVYVRHKGEISETGRQ